MSLTTTDPPIFPRRAGGRPRLLGLAGVPLVTALGLFVLASCGGDEATADPVPAATASDTGARPAHGLVTAEQASVLATDPGVTVIDVRTPEEYAEGHLDGAVLVDFSAPTFADEIARLDPTQPYLVYCRSGNRSGQAVAAMQQLGFGSLWDMDGGVIAWTAAGFELVS
jgi:rhodanese-related sulfurtransferase